MTKKQKEAELKKAYDEFTSGKKPLKYPMTLEEQFKKGAQMIKEEEAKKKSKKKASDNPYTRAKQSKEYKEAAKSTKSAEKAMMKFIGDTVKKNPGKKPGSK